MNVKEYYFGNERNSLFIHILEEIWSIVKIVYALCRCDTFSTRIFHIIKILLYSGINYGSLHWRQNYGSLHWRQSQCIIESRQGKQRLKIHIWEPDGTKTPKTLLFRSISYQHKKLPWHREKEMKVSSEIPVDCWLVGLLTRMTHHRNYCNCFRFYWIYRKFLAQEKGIKIDK